MTPAACLGCVPVTAFGARGDGRANDTASIQAAIDACGKARGGRVLVPPGSYRTGTLFLRDHVDLHLLAGATLLGSPDQGDYNSDDVFPENRVFTTERVSGAHLIIGHGIAGATISGRGCIDGNSSAFFGDLPPGERAESYRFKRGNFPIPAWRPGQMIWFCNSRDISVCDVALSNAPYWTLMFFGCERVQVRGLRISNPPETANGDGIDVDCCRDVTISDCIMATGDDCITLRGNSRALGREQPCENVTVSNCVLRTPCNCVRVGVGDGTIRQCVLSNLVMGEARTGVNVVSRYSARSPRGACIQDVQFANLSMDVIMPLQIIHGEDPKDGAGIRNLAFRNVRARAAAGFYIGGNPDNPVRNLLLSDWDLQVDGGTDNETFADAVPYPYRVPGCTGMDGQPALPAAVYARFADGLILQQFRLHWGTRLGRVWQHALWFEDCAGLVLPDPTPPGPPGSVPDRAVRLGSPTAGSGH